MAEASTSSYSGHVEEEGENEVKTEKPSQVDRYFKKPGGANMAGELYEMKLAALLFIRCLMEGHPFKIATNMNAAGSFDDIVMGLSGQLPVLMQLKHRSGQGKAVYDNQFTQLKGDFALLKYCETYSSLKKQWGHDLACCGIFERCVFVLYTNARVACLRPPVNKQKKDSKSKKQDIKPQATNMWQSLLNTGGSFCPILRETHPKLYETFEKISEYKRILKERNSSEELLKVVKALGNKDAKEIPRKEELDGLAAALEKLKGVDCYEEFLPRVWIFGGQAGEQNLNSLIENDIKKLLGVSCSKSMTNALLESIQRWWQYDNRFLNADSRLWQEILESRWELLSSAVMNRLLKIMIEFDQQEIKRLKEQLMKNIHLVHILAADSPILTCLKVVTCLKEEKFVAVDRETFERNHKEIISYSKRNIFLVLFCEDEDFAAFMRSIDGIQMKEGNWKVILISRYKHNFETTLDICNLSQLQEKSREILLRKHVNFQGQEVPLKYIINEDEKMFLQISGETIVELLNDHTKMAIGEPPTEIIEYYINRTLQRKDNISKEILKENTIFAISGKDDLRQLVPEGEKVMTFMPDEKVEQSCRIFEIRDATDFETISRTFKNIHWLQGNGEFFQWVQSKGTIQIIKKYLARAQAASSCNQMSSLSERLVVLIAEPGMGKSTLMSYIAREMKKLKSSSWVIKINLNDYGEYLSGKNSSPLGLLERALNINGDFQKGLLQLSLDVIGNIAILLDGFDEISPYYAEQVIAILEKLLHDTRVEQIWVTSRPIMKEKLEQTFCTLSYVLKPFSEADQKAFLRKFWNVGNIEEFATKLLNFTGRWLNDKLGEFTGIPLQTMMLAEAFREEMFHYRKTRENTLPERLDILQLYEKFIDIKLKIYFAEKLKVDLYNAGIKAKSKTIKDDFYEKHMICAILSIFSQEEFSKLPSLNTLKQKIEGFLKNVQQGKEKTGIIMSVINGKPTFIHRTFAEYFAAMWLVQNYSENQELVEHILFSPTFEIMRIFFDRSVTRNCILHVAVLNEDKHLVKQLVTSEPAVINSVDKCGRTALHMAVNNYGNPINDKDLKHSRLEILEAILFSQKHSLTVSDKLLCWTPLKYVDKIHAWQVIDLLLQAGADEKDMEFTNARLQDTMFLRVTLRQNLMKGNKNMIQYLIRCKPEVVNSTFFVEVEHMNRTAHIWVTPLHEACLRGHTEIVELLIENGANLEAQDDTFGETPLLWAAKSSQWDIVNLLISNGADVTATSRETDANVIHFAAKSNNVDLLYLLVQDESLLQHVNAHTLKHNSPVWEAAKAHKWANVRLLLEKGTSLHCHTAPNENTLLHFAAKSADNDTLCLLLEYPEVVNQINAKNGKGDTSIECAARAGKWDLVQSLLTHGAVCTAAILHHAVALGSVDIMADLLKIPSVPDLLIYSSTTEKSMLLLAANSEQWDMFTFLIKHGLSLPAHSGTTVLHLAVKSNDPDLLDFVLDHSGLDVDVLNKEEETSFMCAAREANLYALEHLLERGADPMLVHPTGGYTALHLAAECDVLSVVTFLLENTGLLHDINRIDSQGNTPLMRALPRKHGFGVSRHLLQFDVECNHRYESGETLMHAAAKAGRVELGQLLLDRRLSHLERDAKGRSPLHVAASKGKVAFVEWLLLQGANVNELDIDERTPLLWAIGRNHPNYVEVAKLLLKYGADPNQLSKSGKTPLHLAAFTQSMVEVLLKWEANPTIPDSEGKTPLHHAAHFHSYPAVMHLVKHGADPNKRDNLGRTPYDLALEARAAVKTHTKKRSTALNYLEKVTNIAGE